MKKQSVQIREVKEKDAGIRLDKWFQIYFPNLKFTHLQKLFRTGQIRLDSKRVKGNARIEAGQKIRIPPLDFEASSAVKNSAVTYKLTEEERELLKNIIIYEDKNIIALNKPYGIAVQGGTKQKQHIDGMITAYAKENNIPRPHLLHRLDKETTGVLLLAKDEAKARKLGKMFKEHKFEKYYWAVCLGKPEYDSGEIIASLKKHKASHGEYVSVDEENGKFAKTYYQVIEQLGNKLCFVVFKPMTGRTHQLRVHASIIGCPILGEKKYADAEQQLRFQEILQEEDIKLHLHAKELVFKNIFAGNLKKYLEIEADLPEHMQKTWQEFNFPNRLKNGDYFND